MDDAVVIKVDNVSKKFSKSLNKSLFYGVSDFGRNLLGFSTRLERLRPKEFWAVDNISFEVARGDILGLIGPNGSGKSTILKMINGIFRPDQGEITVRGRVGALIAAGVGFHPLFTGRENIYLSAAIMGMTRVEVNRKFAAIVEFADIGDFLDTPVKNYSSGMFVRLGFSIAVHCEPDILLIDEILAVGDVEFRRKALERLREYIRSGEKTIIYVSHNLASVLGIANKALLLDQGQIVSQGESAKVIADYDLLMQRKSRGEGWSMLVDKKEDLLLVKKFNNYTREDVEITSVWAESIKAERRSQFSADEDMALCFSYKNNSTIGIMRGFIWVFFRNEKDVVCSGTCIRLGEQALPEELPLSGIFRVWFKPLQLTTGRYRISIGIFDETFTTPFTQGDYGYITAIKNLPTLIPGVITPLCWPKCDWELSL